MTTTAPQPSASAATGPWPGRFVWHDLMTKDGAAAQRFYVALFGWQVRELPMGPCTYRMIECGPGPIGGIVEEPAIPHAHWMPYVAVKDVDAAAKRVVELGGSICVPPTDIPQTGRFAVCGDPSGATFSIYAGLPDSPGFDPDLPVPGRICWNETWSDAPDAAQRFYTELFGWKPEPKDLGPAGTYFIQKLGDRQAGGLMKNPMPGTPSCWVVYFHVESLSRSGERAKAEGATAMMEGIPIPEVGSFSMFSDPTGALFVLFEPAADLGAKPC